MKTYLPKEKNITKKWWVVDADGVTLGKLATEVARLLRGKHKPIFTPHLDTGDFVIVVNAEKVRVTGKKLDQKLYRSHSGYLGNLREFTLRQMLQRHPEKVIEDAVWGMLPKNRLGRRLYRKLKVYRGPNHPHEAQKPEKYEIKG